MKREKDEDALFGGIASPKQEQPAEPRQQCQFCYTEIPISRIEAHEARCAEETE